MAEDSEWSSLLETAFIAVLESADEGIVVFDRDGRCRMIGRRAGELFGVEPAKNVGRPRAEVLALFAQSCEEPEAFMQTVGMNDLLEPPRVAAELDLMRPRPRTVLWTTYPIVRDGQAWGRLGLVRDVTRERSAERSQKQLQNRLDQLLPLDSLTGLPNARRFREELEREHGRSTRAWDSYAVIRLDVDGMKELNDEYGVPIGDTVLEQVAERLNGCRREYDVLARLEADEFAVLLPGADSVAANAVAQRMLRAVSGHEFDLADAHRVTLSAGGCVWVPPSGEMSDDILRRAGDALVGAKGAGRGRVTIDATQG